MRRRTPRRVLLANSLDMARCLGAHVYARKRKEFGPSTSRPENWLFAKASAGFLQSQTCLALEATEARRGVKCSLKRPTHHQGWLAQAQSAAHQGCLAQAQSEAHSARVASASSSIASPAPAGSLVRWVLKGASAVVRAVAASAPADWFPILVPSRTSAVHCHACVTASALGNPTRQATKSPEAHHAKGTHLARGRDQAKRAALFGSGGARLALCVKW